MLDSMLAEHLIRNQNSVHDCDAPRRTQSGERAFDRDVVELGIVADAGVK